MKVLFLTNQASYHQMDFARAMVEQLGEDNFRIVFQKPTSDARAEMGWQDNYDEPYVIRFWKSADEEQQACQWIAEADVVIQGRFPIKYLRSRIKQGRLTFACQERLWKKPPSLGRKLSRLPHLIKNYYSVNRPNYHFLAIGAYAASDLNDMGIFRSRSWRYGYFMQMPDFSARQPEQELIRIIWCARFSAVKQPHQAIQIIEGLRYRGLNVSLTMIGDGDLRTDIEATVAEKGLSDAVEFTGWIANSEVVQRMRESDLFLMTSHHGEGWGMVVNEAMSHGCCVLADRRLGSAACLIEHARSGYLYDPQSLASVLDEIAKGGREKILEIGETAHGHIRSGWSSEQAALRTIALSGKLLAGDLAAAKTLYSAGLCSWVEA